MKNVKLGTLLLLICSFLFLLAACNKQEVGIQAVLKENSEIYVSEEFGINLFDVKVIYSDGSLGESLVEGFDINKTVIDQLGTSTLIVSYNSFSVDVTVFVQERKTIPFMLNAVDNNGYHYYVGDEFNPNLVVTTILKDGTTQELTTDDYTVTGFSSEEAKSIEVTIAYQELSTKLVYTIVDGQDYLVIDGNISTIYALGQEINLDDISVYHVKADGINRLITDYEIEGFDTSSVGSKLVSITYLDCSISFEIIVVPIYADSVVIDDLIAVGTEMGVKLSWEVNRSDLILEYEILRHDNSATVTVSHDMLEHVISGLTNDTEYSFAIRARLISGVYTDYQEIKCEAGKIINLYVHYGTLPVLYAALELYTNHNESYIYVNRTGTINMSFLPSHVTEIFWDHTMNQAILNHVIQLKEENPNARFSLYVDDLRVGLVLDFLYAAGIASDKQSVFLLPDGTGSYSLPNQIDDEFWTNAEANWNSFVAEYEAGATFKWGNQDPAPLDIGRYAYYVATLPNVEYWIQYPSYIKSNASPLFNEDVSKMNFVTKNPFDVYKSMTDKNRAAFEKMVLTGSDPSNNIDYFNEQFLNNEKIPVVITGTNFGGATNETQLANNSYYIDQVIADFPSEQYQLFFKAHPSQPPQGVFLEYLESNDIIVLPYRTPMEIILWIFPEVLVGGYQSTLYLAPVKGNTAFFFGNITNEVLLILKNDGYFDGAKYYL